MLSCAAPIDDATRRHSLVHSIHHAPLQRSWALQVREHVEIALKARLDDVYEGSASPSPGIITRVTLT